MATDPSPTDTSLLAISHLDASYGAVRILSDVALDVVSGESLSVLGTNGAGKTTLLRAIAGLTVRRRGSIRFNRLEIGDRPADAIVAAGISLVPEGRQLFAPLTVMENLEIGSLPLRRRGRHAEAEEALALVLELFPRLAERRRQEAGTLSGGEQQMVAIGRALAAKPRLLLLDEPSVGLAPKVIEQLFEVFHRLKRSGLTIVLAEQNVRLALDLADRAVLLSLGRVSFTGTPDTLRGNEDIRRIYLGG